MLPIILLTLPLLLAALPAVPRFTPDTVQDAITLRQMAAEKRLIKTGEHTPAKWMTNDDINQLYMNKIRFMDITETQDLDKDVVRNVLEGESAIPTVPTQQAVVKPILALGTTDMMKSVLKTLTEFNNRYYRSSTGQQSADWLFGKVQEVIAATGTKLNVTTSQFKHSWNQSSIITRIEGKSGNQETVILGAHQDSINGRSPMSGRSQGADDDGSGTVTILEALRMILVGGYEPLRPVEFHWYSGEEAGLLGSQAIAKSYKAAGRLVAGMLQTDMTMFPSKTFPHVGILTDYTDPTLTQLLRGLVTEYTGLPMKDFRCGYGCSDHASWSRASYPAAFPAESSNMEENPYIHTDKDNYDTLNFDHGLLIAKLAVGFVVELSHP